MTVDTFKADILTQMAVDWLRKEYPDAIIMREFNAAKYGLALMDVAAITDNKIIGIEIKGEGDSPARLKLQGPAYSAVASHMFLLASPDLDAKIRRNSHMPWGWHYLKIDGDVVCPEYDRGWVQLKWSSSPDLANAPAALLDILWKPELMCVARAMGCSVTTKYRVDELISLVAEHFPLSKIRLEVIKQLGQRDWNFKTGIEPIIQEPLPERRML